MSSTPTPPPPPPPPAPDLTARAASGPFANVGTLSKAVAVLVAIAAGFTVAAAVISAGVVSDAEAFLAGDIDDDAFESAIGALSGVQSLGLIFQLAAGVVTILWMYRIAANLRRADRATTWNPLFAVFGWILPPLLFVIPFLMLRELWKASDRTALGDRWRAGAENAALWAWIVAFGVLPALIELAQIDRLADQGLPTGNLDSVAETIRDNSTIDLVSAALTAAAAVAWIVVVRQLTARHTAFTGEARD